MPRKPNPADKRLPQWSDSYALWADQQATLALATVSTIDYAPKRLRAVCGVLSHVDELRELKRSTIEELRSAGMTWRKIGAITGVSAQTVCDSMVRKRPFPH